MSEIKSIAYPGGPLSQAEFDALYPEEQEGYEAFCKRLLGKCIQPGALSDPDGAHSLKAVQNVRFLSQLTGEFSPNKTRSRYGVGGTDLGISFNRDGKSYFLFGDSFVQENQHKKWRSNVLWMIFFQHLNDPLR